MREQIKNPLVFEWTISTKGSLDEGWDYLSNTDRINQSIGTTPVTYHQTPNQNGGSFLYGRAVNVGFMVSEYLEYPYEWIENRFISVDRIFTKGSIKKLYFTVEVNKKDNEFLTKINMVIEPSSFFYRPFISHELKKNVIPRFRNTFKHIENYLLNKTKNALPVYGFKPGSEDKVMFQKISNMINKIKISEQIKTKMVYYILDTPDAELIKIKPYFVARKIGENKRLVLEFFLRATKEGLFNMNWDILCPSCRGAGSSSNHLNELKDEVHCPTCNIDYGFDFDKSVELTFTPNEIMKTVVGGTYCFGGPGTTPHIRAQLRISPKSERLEKMNFKVGTYRIFSLQRKEVISIIVNAEGIDVKEIEYPTNVDKIHITAGEKILRIKNSSDYEIVAKVERTNWLDDVVTAFEVTSMQEFRDLFSSEVLRPGQEISIQSIAILFTDLKGSTKFYNDNGDAFAYKVVSEHFELLISNAIKFEGAVVKTIGDAIMGIFVSPLQAIKFSIEVQKEIIELNAKNGADLINLKIGIHYGHVLAVTMNDRMDYFGASVNLAARTEGQCHGGDIVITQKMYEYPGVSQYLLETKYQLESFKASLKGFTESFDMVRIYSK